MISALDIQPSDFIYQSQLRRLIQAQGIVTAIAPFIPQLSDYLISESDLATLNDCIAACKIKSVATAAAKTNKKTVGTAIQRTLKATRASLEIIDALIGSGNGTNNPDLINEYRNYRQIVGKAARNTGISVTISDATTGKGLSGATINFPSLKRTATTNAKGVAEIIHITKGSYQLHCAASGYVEQVVEVVVSRGRVVKIEVKMWVGE